MPADLTPPTAAKISVSGAKGESGWYKSDVVIRIIAGTDVGTGVKGLRYRVEGAQETAQVQTNNTSTQSLTITKNGISRIIAYTIDNAGNLSPVATQEIKKDNVAPSQVSLTVNNRKNWK